MSDRHTRLRALAAAQWKLALTLTGSVVGIYFGIIFLIAFNKPLLGRQILPGLSLGILLGALVIVLSWALTWIYVRWANRHYDDELGKLRQ